MKSFYMLLQREYWENRGSFAFTPIGIGAFFVGLLIFALFGSESFFTDANREMGDVSGIRINGVNISGFDFFAGMTKEFASVPLEQRIDMWTIAFHGLSALFMVVLVFVSVFYLLGALYDDRRDRSILFWKSLPVSDLMTVTSKVAVVFLVLPVLFAAGMLLTYLAIMFIGSIIALVSGGSMWASIWEPAPFISTPLKILYAHIIHTMWAAPVIGWLLFVSSWTKRKPILIATIPVGAISFLEFYYNRTAYFATTVSERTLGWFVPMNTDTGVHYGSGKNMDERWWNIYAEASSLLTTTQMWVGLLIGAVFFAGAVYVRRYRDESL